jgi:lactase-phlorizin hydrolase
LEEVNQPGVDYYNRLINSLLEARIQPIVTIFHFDLPQVFAETEPAGWLSESLIQHFSNYARLLFRLFGDRVKVWLTINEPWIHALAAYDLAWHPPAKTGEENQHMYAVVTNMLKAHAAAYRIYEAEFKGEQEGRVGIPVDSWWCEAADLNSEADQAAAERAMQFKVKCLWLFFNRNYGFYQYLFNVQLGIILHPLVHGSYPPVMREFVDRKSKEEGLAKSRLPEFGPEWSAKLKGSERIGMPIYTDYKLLLNSIKNYGAAQARLTFWDSMLTHA